MVLTTADDWPIHQTAEPIAHAGTDRNFYDRYFFNGYPAAAGDDRMFALAFGVYPQIGIADASFCWMTGGRQINLHASRWLGAERMDLNVKPVRLSVEEPLHRLRLTVDAPDEGVRADIVFTGRSFPVEEPRFTRVVGTRTLLDYTRLTQNGAYSGWVSVDGARTDVAGFVGTRDRSWGVRPIGARDPQPPASAETPQFFWLWSPCAFDDGDLFFHTNDDEQGRPWNRRALWVPMGSGPSGERPFEEASAEVDWRPGTRNAAAARLSLDGGTLDFAPSAEFVMAGLGYGHPTWAHGMNQGERAVEREDWTLAELDRSLPHNFHVQALCDVRWTDVDGRERPGRGVLEQLAIGAHRPSGFTGLMDLA